MNELHGAAVARLLGCDRGKVYRILDNPQAAAVLKPCRRRGHGRYTTHDAWFRLACEMPDLLAGLSEEGLAALLQSRILANEIAEAFPGPDYRIQCVETGQVFASCSAAAKQLHVEQNTIATAVRQGRPVKVLGLTFQRLSLP